MESEDETVQTKPIAETITPLIQRQVEPEEEEEEEKPIQTKLVDGPLLQRQEEEPEEEEEEEPVQAKQAGGQTAHVRPGLHARINSMKGGGQPLPHSVRNFFEPRFEYDFSGVRVHTDVRAAEAARAVNARAFTVGKDVVFGVGQYARGTAAGRKLLGHELTHVVQQQGLTGHLQGTPAAKTYPYSVSTTGCDKTPFNKATIEAAVRNVFIKVRDSNCILTEFLKEEILAEFDGLNIDCEQGTGKRCGWALYYFSKTVNIYARALGPDCGGLEATILHEIVHLTEWRVWWGHGSLAWDCQMSCYGTGKGDASKCTGETGFVPVLGASAGGAFSSAGTRTQYGRLYIGLEKRGPVLGFIYPSFGLGVGLIGESMTRKPGAIPFGTSTLVSLLGGIRMDPGKAGGGHLSFFGGPAVVIGSAENAIGAEAGMALGYRWHWLDFSLEAGVAYDPTREAEINTMFTVGPSIRIGPSVPR